LACCCFCTKFELGVNKRARILECRVGGRRSPAGAPVSVGGWGPLALFLSIFSYKNPDETNIKRITDNNNTELIALKQKVTKSYIQNHFRYQAFLYIGLAVISFAGLSLLFEVTKYVPPPEKQIIVYVMDDYYSPSQDSTAVEEAQAAFPEMELVEIYGTPITSYEGQQKFMLTLAANEGDVYIIDKSYLSYFVKEMIAEPLDEYIESGIINTETMDLKPVTMKNIADAVYSGETDNAEHVYAIPANKMYGLMLDFFVDNRNKLLLIPSYSGNKENAAKMVQWLYDRYYQEEEPDYVKNYDILKKQIDESGMLGNPSTNTGY
jgi:hypothetical protein